MPRAQRFTSSQRIELLGQALKGQDMNAEAIIERNEDRRIEAMHSDIAEQEEAPTLDRWNAANGRMRPHPNGEFVRFDDLTEDVLYELIEQFAEKRRKNPPSLQPFVPFK